MNLNTFSKLQPEKMHMPILFWRGARRFIALGHDLFAAGQTMLFAIVAFNFALLGMRLRKKTLAGEVEIYIHSQITSQPCRRPTGILKQHPKVAIAL
jgi:hypothetical protein